MIASRIAHSQVPGMVGRLPAGRQTNTEHAMRQHHRQAAAAEDERQIADEAAAREASRSAAEAAGRAEARQGAIRLGAYRAWEAAGSPPGDGVAFWLQA